MIENAIRRRYLEIYSRHWNDQATLTELDKLCEESLAAGEASWQAIIAAHLQARRGQAEQAPQ